MSESEKVMPFNLGELPKKYKKEFSFSYALGPFPAFEAVKAAYHEVLAVYLHEGFTEKEKLEQECRERNIPFLYSNKALQKISDKDICYAAAVVKKQEKPLEDTSHVVLVNPADMGNLGTIIRTVLGFGIRNLAIIGQAADVFHPKVIRASMGALFRMNISFFADFESYRLQYAERDFFPFMLDGGKLLTPNTCPQSEKFSLIFGNEASGLPPEYQHCGQSLFIPQTEWVDSLNLAVSVGIGTYIFTQNIPGRK